MALRTEPQVQSKPSTLSPNRQTAEREVGTALMGMGVITRPAADACLFIN